MIIAFTGHRKIGGSYMFNTPEYLFVKETTKNLLSELKPEKCISGMAIGFDSLAAELCIELQIPFIAAVPFKGQKNMWPQDVQRKYSQLLEKAEQVVTVSDGGYSAYKMQIRNEWMIDNSDMVLACWNELPGGTTNAVNYAKSKCKKLIIINPDKQEVVQNVEI